MRRRLKQWSLAAATVLLLFGSFELLAATRLVDYRVLLGAPGGDPWTHPGNRLDPVLFHLHRPHDRFRWAGVDYRFDDHGLRNEVDLESAEVVLVGDSFIEGIGVPARQLVTAHLSRAVGRTVANVAQSRYGPQQELELLRRFGLPLRPRICLWAFFEGNDLDDLVRYDRTLAEWPAIERKLLSFRNRSFTTNLARAMGRLKVFGGASDAVTPETHGDISGLFDVESGRSERLYFWYAGRELGEADDRALDRLITILAEAESGCRAHGAAFAVVFVPTKFRVHGDFTKFEAGSRPPGWPKNDLPRRLEARVRERIPGAGFLDLTPALVREAAAGKLVYFKVDSHGSRRGHGVAAGAIAEFLAGWPGQ